MSQETMFTIKTKLDASGFKDLEANAGKSLDTLSREFDEFNRKTKVAPNADDLKKSLEEAKRLLDALTAKKQIVIEKPKTKEVTKELAKLEEMLRQVARRHEILVGLDESAMKEAKEDIDDLKDSLEDLKDSGGEVEVEVNAEQVEEAAKSADELKDNLDEASKKRGLDIDVSDLDAAAFKSKELADAMDEVANGATKLAAKSLGVSQSAAQGITNVIQRMTGLSAVLAGPLGLAVTAAVSGLAAYVLGLGKSSDASRKAESDLESISKYYLKLAGDVEAATKATEEQIKAQIRLLEETNKTARMEVEKNIEALKGLEKAAEGSFSILHEHGVNIARPYEELHQELSRIRKELAETPRDTEAYRKKLDELGPALAAVAEEHKRLEMQADKSHTLQRESINDLKAQLNSLLPVFNKIRIAWASIFSLEKDQKKIENLAATEIDERYKKTTEAMIASKREAIATAKKLAKEFEGVDKERHKKALAVIQQEEKGLKDFLEHQSGARKKEKKTDEERIADLHARYAAQRQIAEATLTDQQELSAELMGLEKAYYTELERLTREHYEKQVASGKALTDAQIAELNRIIEKNKELSQGNNLAELQKGYDARIAIAKKTITDEKKLETELQAIRKQFLQDKLAMLMKEAETAQQVNGQIKDDVLNAIKAVKAELDKMESSGALMSQNVSNQIQQWGGFINDMVSNIGNLLNAQYDARIQSLDKALERELRMLENKHEQEMKMYEDQLEQYKDLEEEKEKLTEDHLDRLEELNWKIQNHVTEDEYAALMEQRMAEDEKYNESMAALEADTIMRDEIRLQQEIAEQEYLARKEQMEKEYAIRRAKMERKQAESQKLQALFSAFVMMNLAMARAFAEHMWPYSMIVAGIVQTASLINMAAIAARPLPEIPSFHMGGTIGAANANNYGYLPPADNPHDKTLFWGQAGEEVLPLPEAESYRRFKAMGFTLAGLIDRSMMAGVAPVPVALPVDNSKTVNQQVTYQVKNELTFSEARRLQAKANRAFVRSLA